MIMFFAAILISYTINAQVKEEVQDSLYFFLVPCTYSDTISSYKSINSFKSHDYSDLRLLTQCEYNSKIERIKRSIYLYVPKCENFDIQYDLKSNTETILYVESKNYNPDWFFKIILIASLPNSPKTYQTAGRR